MEVSEKAVQVVLSMEDISRLERSEAVMYDDREGGEEWMG